MELQSNLYEISSEIAMNTPTHSSNP